MADPFLAEIRILPFNFPLKGWAWCDGQLMPLSQNTALFALLGTTYGGDGKTTFALPNLQGRAPMHPGQGTGLSLHDLGESSGAETVTLLQSEIPTHAHSMSGSNGPANLQAPAADRVLGRANNNVYLDNPGNLVGMAPEALSPAGGDQPHNNMQPYLTFYFNIALQGMFPPRPDMQAVTEDPYRSCPDVALRTVDRAADAELLYTVYASTRVEELAVVPWTDAQKAAFLRMQFDAQDRYWREQTPAAAFDVIVVDGEPGGRLYVNRLADEIRIVDIALLPEHRGRGVGTLLIGRVLKEGSETGRPVTIHVERGNRARALYERLGFRQISTTGVYDLLRAGTGTAGNRHETGTKHDRA